MTICLLFFFYTQLRQTSPGTTRIGTLATEACTRPARLERAPPPGNGAAWTRPRGRPWRCGRSKRLAKRPPRKPTVSIACNTPAFSVQKLHPAAAAANFSTLCTCAAPLMIARRSRAKHHSRHTPIHHKRPLDSTQHRTRAPSEIVRVLLECCAHTTQTLRKTKLQSTHPKRTPAHATPCKRSLPGPPQRLSYTGDNVQNRVAPEPTAALPTNARATMLRLPPQPLASRAPPLRNHAAPQ